MEVQEGVGVKVSDMLRCPSCRFSSSTTYSCCSAAAVVPLMTGPCRLSRGPQLAPARHAHFYLASAVERLVRLWWEGEGGGRITDV